VSRGGIASTPLLPEDYARVAELNERYADLPGDFADLTLICLSERLDIAEILTLDSDFEIYRRFRREPFQRVALG
jgi:predicted nucleic acid-binding protein